MKSSALVPRGGCDGRVKETGDEVDALEKKMAAFKRMQECTPAALQRVGRRLAMALDEYEDAVNAERATEE